MKLKRRRVVEVPPKIKSFINNVTATPFENIEESLKSFVWEFEKGDFHHWVDLFNHFDTFFEKYIRPRKDLQLDDNFLESHPPFPRAAIIQILCVIQIILENFTNKHCYGCYEAVDPDYYKNLKSMLENDVSDIPDLTFSMDADEEKHILYEKTEVTDYELKPRGRNIGVIEETKHEYVDLVADHILTNASWPQINSFLQGFNELVPRELISIFNDKELELLISGLPEIDLDDLKANTEYTGYTAASCAVQWFWEVIKGFNKEDMARLLQFVTGTSKVPLEAFKAVQGISGPQRFQIHKAYGAPERLQSAHTCFNQLYLLEYTSKEQLQERLLLAIHEASEGFGFG